MAQYIDKDKVIEYVKQRLIPTVNHGNIDDWERGADNERINFLSYINSLTEEPTVKGITWEDVNTLESLIYQVHNEYPSIGEKSFGIEVLERFQDCQDSIEEPASEALEEEINYIGKNEYFDFSDWKSIARHFAEWQREKDIKLEKIDDLEEFAQKWAYSNYHKELDEVNCDCLYSGVKKGAEWQKQQDEKLFKEDTWNYIEEHYPDITKEEKLRLYDISIKSRLAGANTIKQQMKEHINNIVSCLEEFLQPGFPIFKAGISEEITWLNSLIIKND